MRKVKLCLLCGAVALMTGCGNSASQEAEEGILKESIAQVTEQESQSSQETIEKKEKSQTSDELDDSLGLLTMKIDQADELEEQQKNIIKYFDNDYFEVMDYDYLQRFPQVFENAQIHAVMEIKKILSATDGEYQALAIIFDTMSEIAEFQGIEGEGYDNSKYVVVNGYQQGMMRVIEGDILQAYGRYSGVDSYTIDGIDYMVPTMNLYDTSYINDRSRFEPTFIKEVAKSVFGPNIEVRNAVAGEDYTDGEVSWQFAYDPYMICELENQTNSRFTKFRFYTERGMIDDAKGASSQPMLDLVTTNIVRKIEFSPDLENYMIFTYDTDLATLNIDYYDSEFNKLWNREFENTMNAAYDYTSKALYLAANNDMYFINLENGEDMVAPIYVGEKVRVSKIEDGILLIADTPSDTVMKLGLDGNIMWKTNTSQEYVEVDCIQRVNGRIVIALAGGWNFIIVNEESGELEGEI